MRKATVLLFAILIILSACKIKSPVLPEWDVTLNVPLMNEKYYASELVDSTDIFADSTDVLFMRNVGETETPAIGNIVIAPVIPATPIPILSGVVYSGSFSIEDPLDSHETAYGLIESGILQSKFSNMLSGTNSVTITFAELRNSDGSPFQIEYSENNVWKSSDLSQHYIGYSGSPTIINDMHFTMLANSTFPQNTPIGQLEFAMDGNLEVSKFEGRLPNYRLDMENTTSSLDIEYPYGLQDAILLQEAEMHLTLTSHVGFMTEFHGQFYAINYTTGDTRTLELVDDNMNYYMTAPAVGDEPGITEIVFTNRVSELLQIMPDFVELRNAYFIFKSTPTLDIGAVKKTDRIIGDYVIDAPFHFVLVQDGNSGYTKKIVMRETVDIEISSENRNRIRDNALEADLAVKVINKLPVGGKAELYVGSNPEVDINDPGTYSFVKTFNLVSGTIIDGIQAIDLSLNREEILVFDNPNVYLQWVFYFEASDNPVIIKASIADYIQVKSMLAAKIHVQESK